MISTVETSVNCEETLEISNETGCHPSHRYMNNEGELERTIASELKLSKTCVHRTIVR